MSLEGEGPFSLHPTAYIRFARCNFSCPLFNNHNKGVTRTGYAELDFNPKDYSDLKSLPLITKGCDSQYSVNPEFSHLWKKHKTAGDLIDDLVGVLPDGKFVYPTGLPVIISLTGGEPTLKWKQIPQILNHEKFHECRHILIETNCSVPFKDDFVVEIFNWLKGSEDRVWTWSNSPKLSNSGERWEEAIRPQIALMQSSLKKSLPGQVNQYFKFVSDGSDRSYEEIEKAMGEYHSAGIPEETQIWVMPEACTQQQQKLIDQSVARECMKRGWLFSYRIQNELWGNGVGT